MTPVSNVIPLRDALDPALVGGKAVNLAAMLRAGLPVPDGFVVTTAAFRARGRQGTIDEALAAEIRAAYERLGRPLVAARSSATAEDMAGTSMAGQYETCLNLATPEALLEAVAKCWASVSSDRVHAYLGEQGIVHESVAMAVVVQRLVRADVAGVLFTTNPRTGEAGEMLLEASWGLGQPVVSGEVQPDIIRVGATLAEVLDYSVADKKVRLLPGAPALEEVPAELRKRACLDYTAIKELCRLGRLAERQFDRPQDIEWAVSGGRVFILQSRAITTLDDAAAYQALLAGTRERLAAALEAGRGPWVRHNLDETLPNPTPLTWDVVRRFMAGSGGFGAMYRRVGFEPGPSVTEDGFLELIGAGIYMDCARAPRMFAENFPFAYDVALLRTNPDAAQQPPTLPGGTLADKTAAARLSADVAARLREEAATLDRRFDEEYVLAVRAWCAAEEQRDLTALNSEALIALWREREAKVMGEFGVMAFLPSMVEAFATAELRTLLEEHFWDDDPDELLHLLGVSSQPDRTLTANAELREVALGRRALEQWLADHGHRAPGEFDLATPRWSERPDDLRQLAAQLEDSPDPVARHHERLAQARNRLSHPDASLEEPVRLVQRYARFREDGKYHLMRAYAVLRQTAQEFGRRLALVQGPGRHGRESANDLERRTGEPPVPNEAGARRLASAAKAGRRAPDDVFFLTTEEMFVALGTGFVPEDRIARRRAAHRAAVRFHTPRVIAREDLGALGMPAPVISAEQWSAHPVSSGASTGSARIVRSPDSAGDLGHGYVMVCPSTDPSWTPLFANAAALILERGGTLSHGAIVARELGLPAVVLENATALFKDGESLAVDGTAGRVARTDAAAPSRSPHEPLAVDPTDTRIARRRIPPPIGRRERDSARKALLAASLWGLFLAACYLLPPAWVRDPAFAVIDACVWPWVAKLGYAGAVALVGGAFSLVLLVGQRLFTDNARLLAAKRRAAALRKEAGALPKDSPRRALLERLAAPVTGRVLKAAMTPLAFLLGPMMLVFLWFPERVAPAVWSAEPGRTVNIVAEIEGEFTRAVTLDVPAPLAFENDSASVQSLPAIRAELEALRAEWQAGSDLGAYPWELQTAGEHAREALLASLDAYLRAGVPSRKLSWRLRVPDTAAGRFTARIAPDGEPPQEFPIVFGRAHPPAATEFSNDRGALRSLAIQHPRPLTQRVFWAPLKAVGGPGWDFGWLGAYLVAYLVVMFGLKPLLRVP